MKIRKGMAKILSTFMAAAIAVSAFAGTTLTASAKSKWDGWLKISSAGDLLRMKDSENKFYLTKDIDLKDKLWNEEINFKGTLDGNGYCIKNLTSTKYGLFVSLKNATVQNIGLYNVKIKTNGGCLGGFACLAQGTTFRKCFVTGTIENSNSYSTAGFVGFCDSENASTNNYTNCVNSANISSKGRVAGIEGSCLFAYYPTEYNTISGDFTNCINYGKIEGNDTNGYVGGICNILNGQMTSCYNLGTVINNNDKYNGAGLAGFATNNAYMTNCATSSEIDIAKAASNCLAQADTAVSAAKFKKSGTYKGFDFGKTWTIDSDINGGRPVLSIMLKHYSGSKPTASVKTGTAVTKGTKIELSTDIKGGVIRYTTNGKTPSASSKKYTDGITINKNTTIKAAVFVNGYRAYVVTLKYTVK